MNGQFLLSLDGATLVNGLANDVHNATECALADGDENGSASVDNLLATNETLCTVHSNGADRVLTQVRSNLEDEAATGEVLDLESVQNRRKVLTVELDIDDGTNDGFDGANGALGLGRVVAGWCWVGRLKREPTTGKFWKCNTSITSNSLDWL